MSTHRAVIINYYFLVHKIKFENLILLSTQVLFRSKEVSRHNLRIKKAHN